MQPTPSSVALHKFREEHGAAAGNYANFWCDFFKKYGFIETTRESALHWRMSFGIQEFSFVCVPSVYSGVKVLRTNPWYTGATWRKLMTEKGAERWMKNQAAGNRQHNDFSNSLI